MRPGDDSRVPGVVLRNVFLQLASEVSTANAAVLKTHKMFCGYFDPVSITLDNTMKIQLSG